MKEVTFAEFSKWNKDERNEVINRFLQLSDRGFFWILETLSSQLVLLNTQRIYLKINF